MPTSLRSSFFLCCCVLKFLVHKLLIQTLQNGCKIIQTLDIKLCGNKLHATFLSHKHNFYGCFTLTQTGYVCFPTLLRQIKRADLQIDHSQHILLAGIRLCRWIQEMFFAVLFFQGFFAASYGQGKFSKQRGKSKILVLVLFRLWGTQNTKQHQLWLSRRTWSKQQLLVSGFPGK